MGIGEGGGFRRGLMVAYCSARVGGGLGWWLVGWTGCSSRLLVHILVLVLEGG